MRLGIIISVALVGSLTGITVYAADQLKDASPAVAPLPKSSVSPPAQTNSTPPLTSIPVSPTKFCGEVGLADNARADCQTRMDAAGNDAERAEIEHTFGMDNGIERPGLNTSAGVTTSKENFK